MRLETIPLLLCLSGAMALAQYPGQYPPGQYPPGQYPPGQSGNCPPGQYPPCNSRRQPTDVTPGRSSKNSKNNKSNSNAVVTTTIGTVRRSVANQVVIEPTDHRIVWYRVTSATKFMKNNKEVDGTSFAPGDHVTLDSTADDEDMYTAVEVRWDKEGTPEERVKATEDWDLPKLVGGPVAKGGSASASSPQREPGDDRPVMRRANSGDDTVPKDAAPAPPSAPQTAKAVEPPEPEDTRPSTMVRPPDPPKDADDPGPPSLRRGVPSKNQMAELPPPRFEPAPDAPPKAPAPAANAPKQTAEAPTFQGKPVDPVIEKAREAAANYLTSLPNYFCQQMTARYQSDHPKTGWDALDVVTADVAYEDGHESYKNIKIGSKAVNKSMEDIGGTRSTGEFSSVLEDLLSPFTDASFRKSGSDTLHGRATWVYKYEIGRERSHWRIEAPSQLYYPAHTGTLWIDKETSRVMRIEQGTINMPKLFPFDTVETVTDYEFISLAAGVKYLLPADAEVLSCVRGTSMCSRNRLEFRNYRKFGADSSITFDGKQ
jgi:hypothetical protein